MRPSVARLLAAAVVLVSLLLLAAPASAHVTVNPREAEPGGFAKLTFRVPNERDDAGTVALSVQLPDAAPFESVSVRPVEGWEYSVERDGETVTQITWEGGPVAPGEFQEFDVSVGPLPEDVDTLVFPAIQTYDDGEAVRWIEEAEEGEDEPERPAPTLRLVAAQDPTAEEPVANAEGDDDSSSDTLAIVALVVSGLALAAGIGALVVSRRGGRGAPA